MSDRGGIIGHGVDIVEIERIRRMLIDHPERFVRRCFTESERQYCEADGRVRAERFAARFAAKEAVFKALCTGWRGGIAWTDVDVTREPGGCPGIALAGETAALAAKLGIERWHLSLSHSETVAMASAIAWGR